LILNQQVKVPLTAFPLELPDYPSCDYNKQSAAAAAAAKSLQSCLTLCDPIDGSPPGSPVPGILQARTLEWVAISFSNAWKWKVKGKSRSRVRLLAYHGLQPTRLLHPWDFPGKSTGVGGHCLLRITLLQMIKAGSWTWAAYLEARVLSAIPQFYVSLWPWRQGFPRRAKMHPHCQEGQEDSSSETQKKQNKALLHFNKSL